MDKDTIIRLAREAGYGEAMSDLHAPALERFAALVATHEREACARMCDFYANKIGTGNITGKALIATAFEIRSRT